MTESSSTPTHEQIARRAYEIFIERGQPAGQDLAHWLEAEEQLRASGKSNGGSAQLAASTPRSSQAPAPAPRSQQQSNGNGRTQSRATARR